MRPRAVRHPWPHRSALRHEYAPPLVHYAQYVGEPRLKPVSGASSPPGRLRVVGRLADPSRRPAGRPRCLWPSSSWSCAWPARLSTGGRSRRARAVPLRRRPSRRSHRAQPPRVPHFCEIGRALHGTSRESVRAAAVPRSQRAKATHSRRHQTVHEARTRWVQARPPCPPRHPGTTRLGRHHSRGAPRRDSLR
eukprot:scaffold12491_cov24-Tisochrysis_lutea.AAC.2